MAASKAAQQLALELSGDTLLHQLVLQDSLKNIRLLAQDLKKLKKKTSTVPDAAELMEIDGLENMLLATNKRGDTPLHLAVARGGREGNEICVYLCEWELELIESKTPAAVNNPSAETVLQWPSTMENRLGETPIFLAALHGNLDAFVLLHAMHPIEKSRIPYYTRKHDGNTILHVAVLEQHFVLAYNIICKHPFLVNCKNNKNETPLHLLARSPTTFRSGYHLEAVQSLLFQLVWVPPLEKQVDPRMKESFQLIKSSLIIPPAKKNHGVFTKCHQLCSQFRKHRAKTSGDKQYSTSGPRLRQVLNKIVFFVGSTIEIFLWIFGFRYSKMDDIRRKRIRDSWGTRVAAELVNKSTEWNCQLRKDENANPAPAPKENAVSEKGFEKESSIFVAAKHGVVVIVEEILKKFPFVIHYEDKEKKNIVLLSVENRQYQVFEYLIKHHYSTNAFQRVDKDGNSVSHLAAKVAVQRVDEDGNSVSHLAAKVHIVEKSCFNRLAHINILGAALHVQWDIKWFKYIGEKVEGQALYNNDGKTAQTLFDENHEQLVEIAGKWFTTSATACSVVAGLVVVTAFATSTTFPGAGTNKGLPMLEGKTVFNVFVVASFFSLCFAVISVLSFLAILTSRLLQEDFEKYLPTNLIVGFVSLFVSVVFMIICYCSRHFFMLHSLRHDSYFIRRLVKIMSPYGFYAPITFPVVAIFIGPHCNMFIDLLLTTFVSKPWRSFARGLF